MKLLKTSFPKSSAAALSEARGSLKEWQASISAPKESKNPEVRVKAVRLTRTRLRKLSAIVKTDITPDDLRKQRLTVEQLFGTLYSGLATYEFMQQESTYRRLKAAGRDLPGVEATWQRVVRSFQQAYATAGLPNIGEGQLRKFMQEFNANPAVRDTIINIANTGRRVRSASLSLPTQVTASFVTEVAVFKDPSVVTTAILNLCSTPITQGSFTKHFSHSISLSVNIKYPCGIGWGGITWCTKTVTLAGVSVDVGVDVGYKINCCGATVWGQGVVQACATIVGINVCAGCTATIVGVAGISRTPVSSGCLYGLGINAQLKCTLAGATILDLQYPFGWTVTGPCPPLPC